MEFCVVIENRRFALALTSDTLKGMWAGMPVPWTVQDQIDEKALRENVQRMCRVGAHGVYTHGTTGEFYAQSQEEWKRVAQITVEECRPFGTPTQVGCTALWTAEVIRRAQFAVEIGADGIQVAFPFWLALSDAEATGFLKEVTREVPGMPVVLYNTARSKKPLTADLLQRLLDQDIPLIGCKGVRSKEEITVFLRLAPQLRIFTSEDQLADWWNAGVRGCYSSLVYTCPKLILSYFRLCEEGHPQALEIGKGLQRLYQEFVAPLAQEGFTDTAFDRTFAASTGFLTGSLLPSRPPYRKATQREVNRLRQCCLKVFPQFLEDNWDAAEDS